MARIEDQLKKLGYTIVAVSPDSPKELRNSVKKLELGYRLFSDEKFEAARSFGVASKVDQATVKKYGEYGIKLRRIDGNAMLPIPAVFLIDSAQTITFSYANPDYKVRLNSAELLKAAGAKQ